MLSMFEDNYYQLINGELQTHFQDLTYSFQFIPNHSFAFSQTGTKVLPGKNEGSDRPNAEIKSHRIMVIAVRMGKRRKLRYSSILNFVTVSRLSVTEFPFLTPVV